MAVAGRNAHTGENVTVVDEMTFNQEGRPAAHQISRKTNLSQSSVCYVVIKRLDLDQQVYEEMRAQELNDANRHVAVV